MAGESGGELGASMLGVAMLNAAPGTFALEVSAGSVQSASLSAVLAFVAAVQSGGIGSVELDALLAFIAQAQASGVSTADMDALLAFPVSQIGVSGVGAVSLDAWLQMLHDAAELANEKMLFVSDGRAMVIENEARTVLVDADLADAIENDRQAVTI